MIIKNISFEQNELVNASFAKASVAATDESAAKAYYNYGADKY